MVMNNDIDVCRGSPHGCKKKKKECEICALENVLQLKCGHIVKQARVWRCCAAAKPGVKASYTYVAPQVRCKKNKGKPL